MSAKVIATATDRDIVIKFLADDTIAVFCQEKHIITVPMHKTFARDRAIAAKNNGNLFGRERSLIARFLESYIDYPEIEAIA